MKIKKQIMIGIIILLIILVMPTIIKAGVESKPTGTPWVSVTISQAYKLCYDLRYGTSTLGNNTLDPHLPLNKDWGAAAYLALSTYGEINSSTPPTVDIESTTYTTTTGNETGILDMGKKYEFTSAIVDGNGSSDGLTARETLINCIETKYVEKLSKDAYKSTENSKGMALAETSGWYGTSSSWGDTSQGPCVYRYKICGTRCYEWNSRSLETTGSGSSDVSFRPIIWN